MRRHAGAAVRTSLVKALAGVALVAMLLAYPVIAGAYAAANLSYLFIMAFLGMSLCLVWGYTGILSFGQSAFFGVGGYLYGIIALNVSSSHASYATLLALCLALLASAACAGLLGYFMFYGGVSDVYVGITTLVTTLVLETFMAQTAGPTWRVGHAPLGGFNGMTNIPSLQIGDGPNAFVFDGLPLYYLVLILLIAVFLGLQVLLRSAFGYAMIAVRENRTRSEMLGYDTRLIQLVAFVLGGALAGLSGILYTSWGNYITPSSMGLAAAVLPVIWVAVGGRKSLSASVISSIVLAYLAQRFAASGTQYALIILAVLLIVAMMFAPEGFVTATLNFVRQRWLPQPKPVAPRVAFDKGANP